MTPALAFLIQMALILLLARALGELLKRLEQPPVLGELLAGILLGPSFLGWIFPGFQKVLFQNTGFLDGLSLLGLVLLMLLTGLETDIRIMRHMGRAALMASLFGIVVPFGSGLILGAYLPDSFVFQGRIPLMLFLATAMGISAMPVIAKILIDLGMVRRDFGILTLTAAVVDDTIGWIVLAMIAGLVTTGSFELWPVLRTLGWLGIFLVGVRYLLFPVLKRSLRHADHWLRMPGGELILIVVLTLACASATEAMHVHAVFGAFVAGVLLRQCPTLRAENLHNLESVTMALFAPLFFGAVGLRVDFTQLSGVGLPALIILIAVSGKVVGCFLGGLLGRLHPWSALALGFCMSARGAMELVVAKIGLDLGILNVELFSCIVLMAVVTSFLAPVLVKLIRERIPISEEERNRGRSAAGVFLPAEPFKILIPVSGGENALLTCHLAAHFCRNEGDRCSALHVEGARRTGWRRLLFWRATEEDLDLERFFGRIRASLGERAARLNFLRVHSEGPVGEAILAEARRNYQFLFVGASGHGHPVYDPVVSELIRHSPCHALIARGPRGQDGASALPLRRILVPSNGSYVADAAFELAATYAGATGASIDLLYVTESDRRNPLLPAAAIEPVNELAGSMLRTTLREQCLERFPHPERLECHVRESASVLTGLHEQLGQGTYDAVFLGAENKSLVQRLYLGQNIETAVEEMTCALVLVIPANRTLAKR